MRFDWTVTVAGVDISQWVKAGGTIDYGKATTFTGYQAPVAVFEVFTKDENPNPAPSTWPVIHVGDEVIIHTTWTGYTQSRRFTGIVQALDYSLHRLRVTATGNGTDWGRAWTGDTGNIYPISIQNDTSRVNWLVTEAGKTVTVEGAAARWVREIPKNSPGTTLLDAVLRVADDCDGLLLEDRLGVMRYRTRNFTRPARVVIPPHLVDSQSIDLVIERGSLINSVAVYYGEPDPATGLQPYAYGIDNASVIEHGEHRAELYTDLQYEIGAGGKAQKYLEKNRLGWQLPDVTLLMNQATGAEADWILQLQENWRVALSPLPEGCPISAFDGDILGFTEVMHETDYRVILHLGMPVGDAAAPPEEPIFEADSLTGGTTYEIEDQFAFRWQVHEFATPGDYVLTCVKAVTVETMVCGGGGGGGGGVLSWEGGGGGAGALFARDLSFTPGSIPVTVGAGGAANAAGGTSKLSEVWCYGGGAGGGGNNATGGKPGGYGGGGGLPSKPGGAGTYGSLDAGVTTNTTIILGGPGATPGGGGLSGAGGGANYGSEITGEVVAYSKPGPGKNSSGNGVAATTPGGGGQGGGNVNGGGGAGAAGTVIVRYRIG